MTEHTEELYREVSDACKTFEGLAETPTEGASQISALAAGFIERAGSMKDLGVEPAGLAEVLVE